MTDAFVMIGVLIVFALMIFFVLDGLKRAPREKPRRYLTLPPSIKKRPPLVLLFLHSTVKQTEHGRHLTLYTQDEHKNEYIFQKLAGSATWIHYPDGEPAGEPWGIDTAMVNDTLDELYTWNKPRDKDDQEGRDIQSS